jgi:ferric enterobactin receptor
MKTLNLKTLFFISFIIFLIQNKANAQRKANDIVWSGIVIDSVANTPLPYITLTLLNKTDGIIGSGVTQKDGSFKIQASTEGPYNLRIQGVGFNLKNLNVDNKERGGSLGFIYLSRSAQALNAVTVAARKQIVKQEADRLSYDLQADPQSKVSSLLEMMRKVPYLSVDGNDNVLLNGSNGYKIYINGKPSGLLERNPKNVLRSMPASTIQRIEVITNPSSKYDAEGLAGIINIITVKKIDNGYHGSINLNNRFPVGGPGAGLSFTYKRDEFGVSVFTGAGKYHTTETRGSLIRNTYGRDTAQLSQSSGKLSDSRTVYAGLELSFEADSLSLLSVQFNINGSSADGSADQTSKLTALRGVGYQYNLINSNNSQGDGIDAGLNYQKNFRANKDQSFSAAYRYMSYNNTSVNSLQLLNLLNYNRPNYDQYNNAGLIEHTLQIDYAQPVKTVLIEAGAKGIFRRNKSNYDYIELNSTNGNQHSINDLTNVFDNSQNVFAAYNTYTYVNKQWTVKAGVRIEQTSIRSDNRQGSPLIKQDYLNVVPSLIVSRKLGNGARINLSYANRIQRPAVAQLNPFVDRSNPDFEMAGNPRLRPVNSNAYQLTYSRSGKATFNVSLGYLYFKSLINQISSYDTARNITSARYENTGKGRIVKTNLYFNYQFSKKLSFSLNSDLRYIRAYADIGNLLTYNSKFMAYVNISGNYQIGKSWRVNGDFTFNSAGLSGVQTNVNGYMASTLSANKDLIANKLIVSASLINPFTKYRMVNESISGYNFDQQNRNSIYYRSFAFSLNYRFGRLKGEIKKTARGIKNDDLSN